MENGVSLNNVSYTKCENCINSEGCKKCVNRVDKADKLNKLDKLDKNDGSEEIHYFITNTVNGIPITVLVKAFSVLEALKQSYIEADEWTEKCFNEGIWTGKYLTKISTKEIEEY